MKKYSNKKGSSLIIVLGAFAVLTIVGIAMLTLTLSTYKYNKVESSAKTNFYLSEGGLEEAYGLLSTQIDSSVNEAKHQVDVSMSNLNLEEERIKVLSGENTNSPYKFINKDDGSTNQEEVAKWQNDSFQSVYKQYFHDHKDDIKNIIESHDYAINSDGVKPTVVVKQIDDGFSNGVFNVKLQSTFQQNSVKKIVSTTYQLSIPKYNDTFYVKSNSVQLAQNFIWSKGISLDGNMKVNAGNVTINGNIYVKGSGNDVGSGIDINGSTANLTINGDVSTPNNFQLSASGSRATVKGNIYAGDVGILKGADGAKLDVKTNRDDTGNEKDGNVFTNNDLALNGESSVINILGGYYGLSDGSDSSEAGKSSTIKINAANLGEADGASLTIMKDSIINGTSYVQTNPEYQTGESLSIKGNYIAYTYPLNIKDAKSKDKSLTEDNIYFDYYNPLRFISKFKDNSPLFVEDKNNYFYYYQQQYGSNSGLKLGDGIHIPDVNKVKHLGTIVANGQIYKGNLLKDDDEEINEKTIKLKQMIYKMGIKGDSSYINLTAPDESLTVNQVVNFSNLKNRCDNNKDKFLLLNNTTMKYALAAPGGDTSKLPNNVTIINLPQDGKVKGIVLTRGDIYLCGPVDFTGTIMSTGNLYLNDNMQKNIRYNDAFVKWFIAYNGDKFTNVFTNPENNKPQTIEVSSGLNNDNNIGTDIVRNKLIKMKNWVVEK